MAFGQPNPAFLANMDGFLTGTGGQQSQMAPPPATPQAPIAQALAPTPHPHFFGEGGAGRSIAGFIGDALLQMTGHSPIYQAAMQHQRELDDYNRKRADDNTDYVQHLKDQERYKPKDPVGYAAELAAMGLTPGTPEFNQRMNAHLNAVDDPLVTMTLPGDHVYSGPRSGLAAALGGVGANLDTTPTVESGYRYIPGPGGRANQSNWTPLGGQSGASQAGGFRGANR